MRIKYHPKLVNDAHFYLTKLVSREPLYWAYYEGESGEGVLDGLSFMDADPAIAAGKVLAAYRDSVVERATQGRTIVHVHINCDGGEGCPHPISKTGERGEVIDK